MRTTQPQLHRALLGRVAIALVCGAAWSGGSLAQSSVTTVPAGSRPATTSAGAIRPAADGPAWSSLSPALQKALDPLKADWAGIDAARKSKWIEVATRLPGLPAAEQQRIRERMVEWSRLSPTERGQARLQFQELRQFSEADRRARWDEYQALPEDARRQLAERARPNPTPREAPASVTGRVESPSAAATGGKRNVVPPVTAPVAKPVGPTVVQVRPGATTTLVTRPATPPLHQQAGLPKIAATEGFVNPSTLLPQRGPQAAAMRAVPSPAKVPAPSPTTAATPAALVAPAVEASVSVAPSASAASQP